MAIGDAFRSIWEFMQVTEEELIDRIRTSVVHAGGVRDIAASADLCRIRMGCYGASDLSPGSLAGVLHVERALPNFAIQ